MSDIAYTLQQQRAIEAAGNSVLVSAAAGSGKTAVLVERCVHLTCDAAEPHRCDIDQLLVLTFTEAAAAQMRSRIIDAIRKRASQHPENERLRQQVMLVEAAQISTIHSFCLWLIKRWFSRLNIDPSATILDAHEAALIKKDVLDEVFQHLYSRESSPTDPLGVDVEVSSVHGKDEKNQDEPLSKRFIQLVSDYGLGNDTIVAEFVLKLYEFTTSLPEPNDWLDEAASALSHHPQQTTLNFLTRLDDELQQQIDHCTPLAELIQTGHTIGHFYVEQIRAYIETLQQWQNELPQSGLDESKTLMQYETLRQKIADFSFEKKTGPRLAKDGDTAIRVARDRANNAWKDVKKRLFDQRLLKSFGLFSTEEWVRGLQQTGPYVETIVELIKRFRKSYDAKKRSISVVDFSDLEQLAYSLLRSDDDSDQPSDIAQTLHRKFAHVMVDEFQDINPIQEKILKLVSHEVDVDRPGNLFVVGDVKQSIYRFRLAEPAIFTRRFENFRQEECADVAIPLQENFRSRHELLEAVNQVFSRLMNKSTCEIDYDESARLTPGRNYDTQKIKKQTIEFHLVEKNIRQTHDEKDSEITEEDQSQRGVTHFNDPAQWTSIEREAYVIGSQIRQWMSANTLLEPDQPLRYRDIVILLRATKVNAERIAAMLNAMNVPAYADSGGSLFGALEVRDVLAVLQLLDNAQQDIPLAAVLRSGIMGDVFSEDDLLEIRSLQRNIPFHEATRSYIEQGSDEKLRQRLELIFIRITRYREIIRRRPLSDVLWSLYEQQNYLAYVSGLPNGAQRRANLLKLHELSRKFSTFRRQGLYRFLRFMESVEDARQDIGTAASIGEAEDVVRIMSIHASKGLEFPIVFVAGLGTKFNLGDRNGRMIFERNAKIGLRVLEPDQMLEYPSVTHQLAAMEIEHTARAEELRILYVAMTRAMDRLILVGSKQNVSSTSSIVDHIHSLASRLNLTAANTYLDWLIPTIAAATKNNDTKNLFEIHLHKPEDVMGWRIEGPTDSVTAASRKAVARAEALPEDEPFAADDVEVQRVMDRLRYVYPQLSVTSVPATVGAGEFKGAFDYTQSPEQRLDRTGFEDVFEVPASKYTKESTDSAVQRGLLTHRVLEHLNFNVAVDAAGLDQELQRMTTAGMTTSQECEMLDRDSLLWFLKTPLADTIRSAGEAYQREFYYTASESPSYFDRTVDSDKDDFVLVRGIVDGIIPFDDSIEIVDFKTDTISADQVQERVKNYRSQMELYTRAMSHLWEKPVSHCWLVFLHPRKIVSVFEDTKQ